MTIQEVRELCRIVRASTNSDRIQSAMVVAVGYIQSNTSRVTLAWVTAMLRDLASYADSYDDPDNARNLRRAAEALSKEL